MENLENNQAAVEQPQTETQEKAYYEAYGGFWRRAAASVLDTWPVYVVIFLLMGVSVLMGLDTLDSNDTTTFWLMFGVVGAITFFANIGYNIHIYFTRGTTIGYELLGMKIISKDTGERKDSWPMIGRWALKSVLIVIPYIGYISMLVIGIMIGVSKKKQGPHDLAAGTVVVIEKVRRSWLVWLTNLIILMTGVIAGVIFVMNLQDQFRTGDMIDHQNQLLLDMEAADL